MRLKQVKHLAWFGETEMYPKPLLVYLHLLRPLRGLIRSFSRRGSAPAHVSDSLIQVGQVVAMDLRGIERGRVSVDSDATVVT